MRWLLLSLLLLGPIARAQPPTPPSTPPAPPAEPSLGDTDPERVARAIERMARSGDRAAVLAIGQRIDAGLPSSVLLRAVDALASSAPAAPLLLRLAQHRRPAVRARVAQALASSHATATQATLADLLDDPDPSVRSAAAVSLGQVGAQSVLDTVLLAATRGVPEAAIVLGQQASAAHVARMLRRLDAGSLEALAPALRILLERANVPRPSKAAIVARLAALRSGTGERLLREVGATLGAGDPLRGAIDQALTAMTTPEAAQ